MLIQKTTIDANGRIPLSSKLRSLLKVKVGEEIILKYHDNKIVITSYQHSLDHARTMIRKYTNRSLLQDHGEIKDQDHHNE